MVRCKISKLSRNEKKQKIKMPKQRKRTERDCRITGTVYERSAGRHLAQGQVQVPQMNYFDAQR